MGRNGLKWGRGLHRAGRIPEKKEGDACAPAGIFEFDFAFGYGNKPDGVLLDYKKSTSRDYFVDDVKSNDYNSWQSIPVDQINDPKKRWLSFERMKRSDHLYELGLVVKHNQSPAVSGKGSAIFFHVQRSSNSPTLGCTAMNKDDLLKIMKWLNPDKKPLLVQVPMSELDDLDLE